VISGRNEPLPAARAFVRRSQLHELDSVTVYSQYLRCLWKRDSFDEKISANKTPGEGCGYTREAGACAEIQVATEQGFRHSGRRR